MLYHLINYIGKLYDFPGERLINYISFRAGVGVVLSLLIGIVFGKKIIVMLKRKLIGEDIRDLGLEGQMQKKGTPTMGGIIILISILVPTLLLADLTNMYTWLMIVSTVWLGTLGFLDDYIKVFKKKKDGLRGKFKIIGQVGLGIIVSLALYFNSARQPEISTASPASEEVQSARSAHVELKTTIPFFTNNEFDYNVLVPDFCGKHKPIVGWIVFMLVTIFIVAAVSNGANLTDGMDGLVSGVTIMIGIALGILAYLSSNTVYANYLNIMFIPKSEELVVFMAIMLGALIGFLWYNAYPAQVFMGDTGSLALGGIIAVFAIIIHKELLIPILCGVYFAESVSVVVQVSYFKCTKRKYGAGRRIFLMAPLHHHYQKKGYSEAKIVTRFWIIAALLAIASVLMLKMR
ncbi:MAG: phospho-N-acetylmuramoyl-pentapeptide-transferase [Prevotellaceae bacterium]|jgi:phospho-N-acetylmuramoyl-pentapeptide-transferase|nr:phospho-N-acetylmuramoyl-pentapeptide-transferase [Prevotellaceae bacterium]